MLMVSNPDNSEFEVITRQCKAAVISQLLPDEYRKGNSNQQLAKATVVALKGRELGVPMMQAFSQINIIKGKPAISAELMLALIYRQHPDADIDFVELDETKCVIEAARPGKKKRKFSFTIEDAKKAGLTSNPTWTKYPRAMCRSRAVSEMARSLFPDVLMGCSYTAEELGANVGVDGEVIPEEPKDVTGTATDREPEQTPQTESKQAEKPPEKTQGESQPKNEPQDTGTKNHAPGGESRPSQAQVRRMFAVARENGWADNDIRKQMKELVGLDSTAKMTVPQLDFVVQFFQENKPEPEPPAGNEPKGTKDVQGSDSDVDQGEPPSDGSPPPDENDGGYFDTNNDFSNDEIPW